MFFLQVLSVTIFLVLLSDGAQKSEKYDSMHDDNQKNQTGAKLPAHSDGREIPVTVKDGISTPGFFTLKSPIAIIVLVSLVVLFIIGILLLCRHFLKRFFLKKVEEYLRKQISANPDYLGQMEIYKDDRELNKSGIVLAQQIGPATFRMVCSHYNNNDMPTAAEMDKLITVSNYVQMELCSDCIGRRMFGQSNCRWRNADAGGLNPAVND